MTELLKNKAQLILSLPQAGTRTGWLLILIISLVGFSTAQAQVPGDLDSTFNSVGFVITTIGTGNDVANAVAVQEDGKIVAGGFSTKPLEGAYETVDMSLVRYNIDGSLDNAFGDGGKVVTDIGYSDDLCEWLGFQSDGKIIAAGVYHDLNFYPGWVANFMLARYNTDGSLDSTFGTDGTTITVLDPDEEDQITAGTIQADDKIVVVGYVGDMAVRQWAVVRYKIDGALDSTFNGTGIFTTNIETYPGYPYAVAIQPDGKIVVGGHYIHDNISDFAALRLPGGAGLAFVLLGGEHVSLAEQLEVRPGHVGFYFFLDVFEPDHRGAIHASCARATSLGIASPACLPEKKHGHLIEVP